jgi:hypothetical protein
MQTFTPECRLDPRFRTFFEIAADRRLRPEAAISEFSFARLLQLKSG